MHRIHRLKVQNHCHLCLAMYSYYSSTCWRTQPMIMMRIHESTGRLFITVCDVDKYQFEKCPEMTL